jgi:Protein of unknown function (DUF3311)
MTAKKGKAAPRRAAKPAQDRRAKAKHGESKTSAPGLIAYWPRLLFAIPVLVIMWVPFYNRTEPSLGGVPFFYWYQLAWILIGAFVVLVVYLIETRVTKTTLRASASVDPGATGDVL